ncbi:helix-turn-helix domain-containing protein [Haloactinopolyspora alba]|uniref:helix-turn-helix domain-containing protein n=1 Tax=Haloactinopolyspora alba TaxID=648780 RepID=UPI00197A80C4|nr:helix-turn-helix domain-containing protein [Haloactinopolyspora alba]
MYDQCEGVLTRQNPAVSQERLRRGTPEPTRGLDHSALMARQNIVSILASWSGLVVDERKLATRPDRTVTDMAAFLESQLPWLSEHPAARDAATEIHDVAEAAAAEVDPHSTARFTIDRCGQSGCDGTARVTHGPGAPEYAIRCTFSRDQLPLSRITHVAPKDVRAPRCPALVGLLRTSGGGEHDRLLTTELAAMLAGVPRATIRKWASRGKLTRHGSAAEARYDLREVLALAGRSGPAPARTEPSAHDGEA